MNVSFATQEEKTRAQRVLQDRIDALQRTIQGVPHMKNSRASERAMAVALWSQDITVLRHIRVLIDLIPVEAQ